ncbi:MAG TPA: FG-GAP-like repeat-containing protein [Acidimicrobiia bacterium]|nr:FG-GAP-like repeat-containing protein [Acidimicrobiia bacterium]
MGKVFSVRLRWLPTLVALSVALSVFLIVGTDPARATQTPGAFENCLLQRLNEVRVANGKVPLQMATDLVPPVRDWSRTMRFEGFGHMDAATRDAILPDNWSTWAENIAWHGDPNLPDCGAMHQMWWNSAGHRSNMLNSAMRFVAIGAYVDSSGWWGTQLFFNSSSYQPSCNPICDDEIFFYRADGLFRYYDVSPTGSVGTPINSGSKYTEDWTSITGIDLDGDRQDEMFFYRQDGLFRFYDLRSGGSLGSPLQAGSNYTTGWDSITAVDLDGDGQDEMFFYRQDGLYRYYNIKSNGSLGTPVQAGSNYTSGWDSITAIDLDGDGQDEMFFYRKDGLYRYYNVSATGNTGTPIRAGSNYTSGWDAITAVSLD